MTHSLSRRRMAASSLAHTLAGLLLASLTGASAAQPARITVGNPGDRDGDRWYGTVSTPSHYLTSLHCDSGGSCTASFPPSPVRARLSARAQSGGVFAGWIGCPAASGSTCSVPLTNNSQRTVQADFRAVRLTVNLDGPDGMRAEILRSSGQLLAQCQKWPNVPPCVVNMPVGQTSLRVRPVAVDSVQPIWSCTGPGQCADVPGGEIQVQIRQPDAGNRDIKLTLHANGDLLVKKVSGPNCSLEATDAALQVEHTGGTPPVQIPADMHARRVQVPLSGAAFVRTLDGKKPLWLGCRDSGPKPSGGGVLAGGSETCVVDLWNADPLHNKKRNRYIVTACLP